MSILFCGSTMSSREDAFRQLSAVVPLFLNSYYLFSPLNIHFSIPSFSTVLQFIIFFIIFSIPGFLILLVLFNMFLGPLAVLLVLPVSALFNVLVDFLYTAFKKINHISRILSFATVTVLIIGALTVLPSVQSYLHPLPVRVPISDEEVIVYISSYGECYHRYSSCSGMKSPRAVTLKEAKEKGRRACSKCYRKKY